MAVSWGSAPFPLWLRIPYRRTFGIHWIESEQIWVPNRAPQLFPSIYLDMLIVKNHETSPWTSQNQHIHHQNLGRVIFLSHIQPFYWAIFSKPYESPCRTPPVAISSRRQPWARGCRHEKAAFLVEFHGCWWILVDLNGWKNGYLVGGWARLPQPEKFGVSSSVGMMSYSQDDGKMKKMFQTTNQILKNLDF